MGNLSSVKRKLDVLKIDSVISSDPSSIDTCSKIILPGVGHFSSAVKALDANGWRQKLNQAVLNDKKPILGICLGMQLMTEKSEESEDESIKGLGWFNAEVIRFAVNDKLRFKVPHTGWNQVTFKKVDPISNGLSMEPEFYFVHAYHVVARDEEDILGTTDYCYPFVSALSKGNIYAVQFHPEKSHETGLQLLKNFISL